MRPHRFQERGFASALAQETALKQLQLRPIACGGMGEDDAATIARSGATGRAGSAVASAMHRQESTAAAAP